ncbi:MAG: acetolactate synthase small subunit [Gammaproteobacteria bacterium TMED222]|nr:MAG: acetolactate synthase small subunit [Gammaproteobacteria bacterium TMED222]|tara:strand:+ start:568 stop:1083 length:516 start_codon:yes stop_codon:yes gene_type:complete
MPSHIAILMENQPGALSRVVGLFSQRGYNIDSLSVAPTQDPTLSRLTMTTSENSEIINQILRQLYKLVDVVMVQNLTEAESYSIELAIIKIIASEKKVEDTISKAKNLEGRILNEKDGHIMFQIWGDSLDIDNLLASMKDEEFLEVTRSGLLGMTKGSIALNTNDQTKISY